MQGPITLTRRDVLVLLSVVSTGELLLTYSASQNLNKWVSSSLMTAWTGTTLYTPRMGEYNQTRIKWAYHTLTPKTPWRDLRKIGPGNF